MLIFLLLTIPMSPISINKIFKDHVANRLNNVFWIDHFWEFLDNRGSLRDDLYGRLGIHLKGKGKGMMARCIRSFQQSFN